MLIVVDFDVATLMMPPIFTLFEELFEDHFDLFITQRKPTNNPLGFEWNRFLVQVVPVQKLPVNGVFDQGQVGRVFAVIRDVELVVMHG